MPPVRSAGLEIGERCEDSAVVIAGLGEDVVHGFLDGALGDPQSVPVNAV
jgi:hypothetical protein